MVASTFEAIWFKNKETSLAMAIDNAVATISSVTMFFIQPYVYNRTHTLISGFLILCVLCAFSLCCGLILQQLDSKLAPDVTNPEEPGNTNTAIYKHFRLREFRNLGYAFWMTALSHMCVSGGIVLMSNVISAFFQERFGLSNTVSGYIAGSSPLLTGIAVVPVGEFIHRYGYKVHTSKTGTAQNE